jgi:hypothetical protein
MEVLINLGDAATEVVGAAVLIDEVDAVTAAQAAWRC